MVTAKLLLSQIGRSRPLSTLSRSSLSYLLTNSNSSHHQSPISSFNSHSPPFAEFQFPNTRSFSSRSIDDSEFFTNSETESTLTGYRVSDVVEDVVNGSSGAEESSLPVLTLVSLLEGFHDLTGLPWWIVIASTTVAMRISLFPILILQLKKLARISELFPKLPPPFPPPFSGKRYMDQFSIFRRKRKAIGCPSYLWFLAYFSVQVPCFLLWMISIRRMSLDHHVGFDYGGTLWFQNLTEFPHGMLGPIFPLLIGGLHYINVQLSFEKSSTLRDTTGLLALLAKYYKHYLDFLTLPLVFIGFCVPQGSLIYWVTNSSLNIVQQLSLKHPTVREKLGLPIMNTSIAAAHTKEIGKPETIVLDSPSNEEYVLAGSLQPQELLEHSVELLSKEQTERAIILLQVALKKDPNFVEALGLMGQVLLQKGMRAEALAHLEHAISKLLPADDSAKVMNVHLLILASQWAGLACTMQRKHTEAILHYERVSKMEEPEDPKSKAPYYETFVFLASALINEGRKAEALRYLQLAAAYNPTYKELLDRYESDEDDFSSDLANRRRRDY